MKRKLKGYIFTEELPLTVAVKDGAPQKVLPVALPVVRLFARERGFWDPEYLLYRIVGTAHILGEIARRAGNVRSQPEWRVLEGYPRDEGYLYVVKPEHELEVRLLSSPPSGLTFEDLLQSSRAVRVSVPPDPVVEAYYRGIPWRALMGLARGEIHEAALGV